MTFLQMRQALPELILNVVRTALLILLLASSPLLAQDVRLSARPNAQRYLIGEWVEVQVEGHVAASVDTVGPAMRDSLGSFEVLSVEREGKDLRWRLRFTTLDSGDVFLPPIPFQYKLRGDTSVQRAYTNSLMLSVAGLPINPQGDIKDIKPPLSAPWTFEDIWPYLVGALVVAAAAGGGYYYYRQRKRKREAIVETPPAVPAHREALAALRALEERRLWQQGKVKAFYSEVTEIIRFFFERRWGIIALELTSHEILLQMKRIPEAEAVRREMESFFLTADLVKFAKYQPSPEECTDELRGAYDIVRAMVPVEASETVPAEEEPADVR
jgi:hypothetical protein